MSTIILKPIKSKTLILITTEIKAGGQIDVIFTDVWQVFDTLNHRVFFKGKLYGIGVHSYLLSWIKLYLSDSQYFVIVSGVVSKSINMSGVP